MRARAFLHISILLPLGVVTLLVNQSSLCQARTTSHFASHSARSPGSSRSALSFSMYQLSTSSRSTLSIQGGGGGGGSRRGSLTQDSQHLPLYQPIPTPHASLEMTPSSRGGSSNPRTTTKSFFPRLSTQTMTLLTLTIAVSYLLWESRERWIGIFDKKKLLDSTLRILKNLNEQPKTVSYTTYTIGMTIWEIFGLSTIPVETASGMVFGWPAFILSAVGKLWGAVIAFGLGRYSPMATWIQKKLSANEFLSLLEGSAASEPLKVAFLMKLSCFPETIKNYGSALLGPIQLWMFVVATIAHGFTFSALWTYLGVDTAKRLEVTSLPVDQTLQFLLTLALINGIVVSPMAMAYWIKTLRVKNAANKKEKEMATLL